MPLYLIERLFDQRKEDLIAKSSPRAADLLEDEYSDLKWLHSHIVASDEEGFVRTFCLYEGPNAERCREHGEATGNHEILNVHEIAHDAAPSESPYTVG